MTRRPAVHWFRDLITDDAGALDGPRLGLAVLIVLILGAVPIMVLLAILQMVWPEHPAPIKDLGIGIGSVCGGFATAVAAMGLYLVGDKRPDQGSAVTTFQVTQPASPPQSSR